MAAEEAPTVQFATLSKEGFQAYTAKAANVKKIEGFREAGAVSFEYCKDGARVAIR
jgi:hypothetical protein